MDSSFVGFREVIPDQFYPEKWREFTINIGGTQALQEIKVPERAGGYSYQNQSKLYTRNRFLYWRISHDVLELVEHSLDVNLVGNALRYRFQDMPVLEGVTVYETETAVVVLVATVSSIHRLTFPHPDVICPEVSTDFAVVHHPDIGVKSIFADAKLTEARDPSTYYVINNMPTNSTLPHISASLLTAAYDSLYALAYANGGILLLNMSADKSEVTAKEVKWDSYVPRFISGITNVLRGSRNLSSQEAVSLILHNVEAENYLFCLYRVGCLAMWSCSRVTCICSLDLPQCIGGEPSRYATEGVQSHMLRKAYDSETNELLLAIYLCFAANSQIVLVRPVQQSAGGFKLDLLITIQAPMNDLVEMSLNTQYLWCVWKEPRGYTQVSRTVVNAENPGLEMAYLEPPPDIDETLRSDDSIGDRYMSYIFDSGRFSMAVISRALSLFRRSNLRTEATFSYKKLRDRVLLTVGDEITGMMEEVMKEEDMLDSQSQCWLRFYSGCVQYNEASTRPVGITLISDNGAVLIKRQQYSVFRPMENLEYLFLSSIGIVPKERFSGMVSLMAVLTFLENNTSSEMKAHFELMLEELNSPDQNMKELLHGEALLETAVLRQVGQKLRTVKDICRVLVDFILTMTIPEDTEKDEEEIIKSSITEMPKLPPTLACLYSSSSGISVVTQSLKQVISVRFSICRNLLILQYLLLEFIDQDHLEIQDEIIQLDYVRSTLIPRTVTLTQAYYSMKWLSSTIVSLPLANKLQNNERHLALLGDLVKMPHSKQMSLWPYDWRPQTVLELLIQSTRASLARIFLDAKQLSESELAQWRVAMIEFITSLSKFVWPMSKYSAVPQLLLTLNQHRLVQEYDRLLMGWCEWNSTLRLFILGTTLLYTNEPQKALAMLQKVARKDAAESLMNILHGKQALLKEESSLIQYYFLLIEMFSKLKHWDCVLKLIQSAMVHATKETELRKLNVNAFTVYLQQGNHLDAFNSLTAITNKECSRLCLHQLVVTMFDRGLLEPLMEFPEPSMFDDLQEVVLKRARVADLQQPYYNFLYAFHMRQGNVRKAAEAMVEQAIRLGQDPNPTVDTVKRQADCYLAGVNALRLAAPAYAWIVKPTLPTTPAESAQDDSPKHPKRRVEGAEIFALEQRDQIEILEVVDLEREYDLVKARLALVKLDPSYFTSVASNLSPGEVVTLCTSAGLYETGILIAKQFRLPLEAILAHLACECVHLTKEGLRNADNTWAWLKENDVWELGIGDANAEDMSWKLLEVLMQRYEEPGLSSLHQAVTRVLLQSGFFLPNWLLASYSRTNCSELLREYIRAGRLEEAAELAVQLLWAILGRSKEKFGFTTALGPTSPYVCMPIHIVDRLVLELEAAAATKPEPYSELLQEVDKMRMMYLQEAMQVSELILVRSK